MITGCGSKNQVICTNKEGLKTEVIANFDNNKLVDTIVNYEFSDEETAKQYCDIYQKDDVGIKVSCLGKKVTITGNVVPAFEGGEERNTFEENGDFKLEKDLAGTTEEKFVKAMEEIDFTCSHQRQDNFDKIYTLLKNNEFYFIDDIILNYLEPFEFEEKYVKLAIEDIKEQLGNDFVKKIGNNMTIINKIIELAISYIDE